MNVVGWIATDFVIFLGVARSICYFGMSRDTETGAEPDYPAAANDQRALFGGAVAARRPTGSAMTALRQGLPELPLRMRALPRDDRGYPVPFFVAWIDGKPDFRVADQAKLGACHNERRCWLCGEKLGRYMAFVIGPMCAVNRISAEPPSHIECARFAAQACPFLARPKALRRATGLPEDKIEPAGVMLPRNPGVALVWVTRKYSLVRTRNGVLFEVGNPEQTFWYAEGRLASRAEVMESMQTGLPSLYEVAHAEGEQAVMELDTQVARATRLFPKHAAAAHIR